MSQVYMDCMDISIFVVTRKHCIINIFLTACPSTKKYTGMCMLTLRNFIQHNYDLSCSKTSLLIYNHQKYTDLRYLTNIWLVSHTILIVCCKQEKLYLYSDTICYAIITAEWFFGNAPNSFSKT